MKHYLITSVGFALLTVPFVVLFRFRHYRAKDRDIKREIAILLFFMCVSVIFCQTALPEQFKIGHFNFRAFHAPDFNIWKEFPQLQTGWVMWKLQHHEYEELLINIAGNILIFTPIGLLAPYIWKKLGAKCILIGFLLSCLVEFIQLFTDRNSDYNDIILNTIGTAIGWLLYVIIRRIIEKKTDSD